MKEVVEYQPKKGRIVTGACLVFPNVQSCVALIAQVPNGQVAGAHLTIGTRIRPDELGDDLTTAFEGCTEVRVIGGISSGKWSNQDLRACCGGLNVQIRKYDTSKHIDLSQSTGGVNIFAQPGGGSPTIYWSSKKSGTWKQLKQSSFKRV
jgi:hypothetical protein